MSHEALPSIKRFSLTNKLRSTQLTKAASELPKSVTEKLEFLKAHKQDLEKSALSEFISKKCSTLSDNERARELRNQGQITKLVSNRTAGLVKSSSLKSSSNTSLSNGTSTNEKTDMDLEVSAFFSPSSAKQAITNNEMDDLDFNVIFDEDEIAHISTQIKNKTTKDAELPKVEVTNTRNPIKAQNTISKLSLTHIKPSIKQSESTRTINNYKTGKKYKFGRVTSYNVWANPFTGVKNEILPPPDVKSTIASSISSTETFKVPVTAHLKELELPELKCQNILPSKLSMPRTPEKTPDKKAAKIDQANRGSSSSKKSKQEVDEFLLSNINWDDEDNWPGGGKDEDLDRSVLDTPPREAKSIICAGDYVDDDFDFSQLGVEDIRPAKTPDVPSASNVIDLDDSLSLAFEDEFEAGPSNPVNFNSSINMMNNNAGGSKLGPHHGFVPIDKDAKTRKDNTAEFAREYPHSFILREILHEKFGLRQFRPNQQECINATLEQHDCFVLMPTGGGKSLCYQLPAIITPGVTVVISPLRALIVDQVNKLNSLDIPAAHMCSDLSKDALNTVVRSLTQLEPSIKLLYLTPEKIIGSKATFDLLVGLYKRGKLARIVLDEAHCLSQWGHDFRPDYKQLTTLKANFPQTPIMCLTATATNVVQQDVITILKLKNVKTFIRSFNRTNIKYAVVEKSKSTATAEIIQMIQTKFMKKSGIVYCLVRKDCDTLAMDLRKNGIKAKSYHAGLADKKREEVQGQWMNNEYHVICATIAFGMGIDKPDVRFVIHNSMPKSLEAFYQESGRGGRDGETSYSYLFYGFGDVVRLQKLVQMDKSITKKNLEGHFDQIAQMAQYCENQIDCRRYLQLLHLGEKFNRQLCMQDKQTICDNCSRFGSIRVQDVAKESRELAQLVRDIGSHRKFTMLHYVDVYRGAKIKKIIDLRHNSHKFYGAGAHLNKNDVHRIMKELSFKKVLKDVCEYTGEYPVIYVQPGPNYEHLFKTDIVLTIPITNGSKTKKSAVVESPDFIGDVPDPQPEPPKVRAGNKAQPATPISPSKTPERRIQAVKAKCHEELLEKSLEFAKEQNCNLASIMNLSAIKTMSENLPATVADFMKIQYVTKANFEKYGKDFLIITQKYRRELDVIEAEATICDFNAAEFEDDCWENSNLNTSTSSNKSFKGIKRKFSRYKRGTWKRKRS